MNRLLLWFTAVAVVAFPVFGTAYEGDNVIRSVTRAGRSLNGAGNFRLSVESNVYSITYIPERVTETIYDCEADVVADDQGGDWKGFFNAPKRAKPAKLMEAIQGLSYGTAWRLVQDGSFASKPRSWSEFQTRIESAELRYRTGFSYDVLVTYKRRNMASLGYLREQGCGYKVVQTTKRVPHRALLRQASREFELHIIGAPLLLGEQETFEVSFDGFTDHLLAHSGYNNYTIRRLDGSNGPVVYELTGHRRQVAPTNSLNVGTRAVGGYLVVDVSDANFDGELNAAGTRFIVGTVEVVRGGWKGNLVVARFERPLSNDTRVTEIGDLNVPIPAGKTLAVRYQLRVDNSLYFSNEPSTRKERHTRD